MMATGQRLRHQQQQDASAYKKLLDRRGGGNGGGSSLFAAGEKKVHRRPLGFMIDWIINSRRGRLLFVVVVFGVLLAVNLPVGDEENSGGGSGGKKKGQRGGGNTGRQKGKKMADSRDKDVSKAPPAVERVVAPSPPEVDEAAATTPTGDDDDDPAEATEAQAEATDDLKGDVETTGDGADADAADSAADDADGDGGGDDDDDDSNGGKEGEDADEDAGDASTTAGDEGDNEAAEEDDDDDDSDAAAADGDAAAEDSGAADTQDSDGGDAADGDDDDDSDGDATDGDDDDDFDDGDNDADAADSGDGDKDDAGGGDDDAEGEDDDDNEDAKDGDGADADDDTTADASDTDGGDEDAEGDDDDDETDAEEKKPEADSTETAEEDDDDDSEGGDEEAEGDDDDDTKDETPAAGDAAAEGGDGDDSEAADTAPAADAGDAAAADGDDGEATATEDEGTVAQADDGGDDDKAPPAAETNGGGDTNDAAEADDDDTEPDNAGDEGAAGDAGEATASVADDGDTDAEAPQANGAEAGDGKDRGDGNAGDEPEAAEGNGDGSDVLKTSDTEEVQREEEAATPAEDGDGQTSTLSGSATASIGEIAARVKAAQKELAAKLKRDYGSKVFQDIFVDGDTYLKSSATGGSGWKRLRRKIVMKVLQGIIAKGGDSSTQQQRRRLEEQVKPKKKPKGAKPTKAKPTKAKPTETKPTKDKPTKAKPTKKGPATTSTGKKKGGKPTKGQKPSRGFGLFRKKKADSSSTGTSEDSVQGSAGGNAGPSFVWATGGHNAAAGHGNFYNQSYTAVMERAVQGTFAAAGIAFEGRNYAMGGMKSGPELGACVDAVYGTDIDVLSWDFAMTDGREYGFMELFLYHAAINPGRPATVGVISGRKKEDHLQLFKRLAGRGLASLYLEEDVAKAAVEKLPDTDGFTEEQSALLPPFVRNFRCGTKVEEGTPCEAERFDDKTVCPDRKYKVKWHPGWKWHALMGNMMAMSMIKMLNEAIALIEGKGDADPALLLAELKAEEDKDLEKLKSSSLTETASVMPGGMQGLDIDLMFKSRSVCHTALLPSKTRYHGILTDSGMVSDTDYDKGTALTAAQEQPGSAGGDMRLVYVEADRQVCPEAELEHDYRDFWYIQKADDWQQVVLPNDSEIQAYDAADRLKGLISICLEVCAFSKCKEGDVREFHFLDKKTAELKINDIMVADLAVIGNCFFPKNGENGYFWKANEAGKFNIQARVLNADFTIRFSSFIVW